MKYAPRSASLVQTLTASSVCITLFVFHSTIPACSGVSQLRNSGHHLLRKGAGSLPATALEPATADQVSRVAEAITMQMLNDAWLVLTDRQEREDRGEDPADVFSEIHSAMYAHISTLLAHEKCYGINIHNIDRCNRVIREAVSNDRVPVENNVQGLRLLRHAWDELDRAAYLQQHYLLLSRVLYLVYLVIGIGMVGMSIATDQLLLRFLRQTVADPSVGPSVDALQTSNEFLRYCQFSFAICSSLVLSLQEIFNPELRKSRLAEGAQSLENVIWRYRTRVGIFSLADAQHQGHDSSPEDRLCEVLNEWREDLIAGSDLSEAGIERHYPQTIYRHYQQTPPTGPKASVTPDHTKDEIEREIKRLEEKLLADPSLNSPSTVQRLQCLHEKLIDAWMKDPEAQILDDHQSPCTPAMYMSLRILTQQDVALKAIPTLTLWRNIGLFALFACSAGNGTLVFLRLASYVSVITAIAASITAWTAFTNNSAALATNVDKVRPQSHVAFQSCT